MDRCQASQDRYPETPQPSAIQHFRITGAWPTFEDLSGFDECVGNLSLIPEMVASQLAKITCPTGR
jgi:hypothetical protein